MIRRTLCQTIMSLDVTLYGPPELHTCRCQVCNDVHKATIRPALFEANITHNLGRMAEAADIYLALWRPEEIGIKQARELIPLLRAGVARMKQNEEAMKKLNAENGWGTYRDFVPWVERYLEACIRFPDAEVEASR